MNATGTVDNTTALKKNSQNGSSQKGSDNAPAPSNSNMQNEKRVTSLRTIFEDGLKEIYDAEKQLLKALPEVAKAAYNEDLQDAVTHHIEQTKRQVERLEKIFSRLGIEKQEKKCIAIEGLIEEARKVITSFKDGPVRDSALIIGIQKVEHYEIACYGSLCELADVLGYHKIGDILDRTLQEEGNLDHNLTYIAQDINDEALEAEYETQGQY